MRKLLLTFASVLALGSAAAQAASVSGSLSITVSPPAIGLVINPSAATVACSAVVGSVVSTASITGGDGNPATFSMTGNTTDFSINPSTGVVTVGSGSSAIATADCGKTFSNTISATQP